MILPRDVPTEGTVEPSRVFSSSPKIRDGRTGSAEGQSVRAHRAKRRSAVRPAVCNRHDVDCETERGMGLNNGAVTISQRFRGPWVGA